MDALSEVLKVAKLKGALFFNGEFSAPWCLRSSGSAAAHTFSPEGGHLILYHFLTDGHAYARLPDGAKEELTSGDIVVFPHAHTHFLGNGSPERPVDSFETFAKNLTEGLKVAKFGGGGEVTRFVCGFLTCEPRLSETFLSGLPSMFKVHILDESSDRWLAQSIRFSVGADGMKEGSGLVIAKLAEVLFVETLRRYISALPPEEIGWLAGARDPVVGAALASLHKNPSHPWTVSNLAKQVGLSRTQLAERFRHFLGDSPIAYLSRWRLKLGAEILRSSENSVAEVAAAVGYGSEAAFNRAFKREFACPPAQFRRQHRIE